MQAVQLNIRNKAQGGGEMQEQEIQVDVNRVIDALLADIAQLTKDRALLRVQNSQLVEKNEALQELAQAYEDKEKLLEEK